MTEKYNPADFIEESLSTPVLGDYDVIVCGGGVAGVSAAVAARRAGAKEVLLIEKTIVFGGLATIGLISLYEPLCDGEGRKLVYGMPSELLQLCRRYGPDNLPPAWEDDPAGIEGEERYQCHYSPTMFALALDEFLTDAGVHILLDTQVVRPLMKERTCRGVIVENKTGRGFYKAKVLVDATGDAQILTLAGLPVAEGQNYLTCIVHRADREGVSEAAETGDTLALRRWTRYGGGVVGNDHPEGVPLVSGVTAEEITDFVLDGRRMLMDKVRGEERRGRDVLALPQMPQLRKIRRLEGAFTLLPEHVGQSFDDSISTMVDFRQVGQCYELPYRMLYHPRFTNLFAAGRIVSADGWAWDVVRVIPGAVATGEAAGAAAALCAGHGWSAGDLDVSRLQAHLQEQGVRLHL